MSRWVIFIFAPAVAFVLYRCSTVSNNAHSGNENKPEVGHQSQPSRLIADGAPENPQSKEAEEIVNIIYARPIAFWGKVVDQSGIPIEGAGIEFSATSTFAGDPAGYSAKSDANGRFSISGIKGATLYVNVRKVGYYRVPDKSYATIAYGYASDPKTNRPPPTIDSPAVFVLQRVDVPTTIKQSRGWQLEIPQDGTPVSINLTDGTHVVGSVSGDLVVKTFVDLKNLVAGHQYPWTFKISVPGGGLKVRKDAMHFDAPDSGYQVEDEIVMKLPTSNEQPWKDEVSLDYFIKLPGSRYGRIRMVVNTDDRPKKNQIYFEAVVDQTGKRHLESGTDHIGNPK